MELPSARRDIAQEWPAIQKLEGGTAEYGMPGSRSQPDPGEHRTIVQLHPSRRGIGCCNHRRMIVADDNVGAAIRQDQIAKPIRVEPDEAHPRAGDKSPKVGRR